MKNVLELSLGILTGIAGFLEAGSLGTSLHAGAKFGCALLWPIALGAIGIAILTEMSGRLAAMSRRTVVGATRERFGGRYPIDFRDLGNLRLLVPRSALALEPPHGAVDRDRVHADDPGDAPAPRRIRAADRGRG